MANYHYRYETPEKEDTEWEAIHRRLGNLPKKEKKKAPAPFKPQEDKPTKDEQWLEKQTEEHLEDLEDDFDDDAFLEQYRKKRLEELKQKKRVTEFGQMMEIQGKEFVSQVTEASEQCWVITMLYQPNHAKCAQLEPILDELASDFMQTKFLKILSEDCIAGYPQQHLPTLLVYHNRSCKKTMTSAELFKVGRVVDAESVAAILNAVGPVCKG